MRIQKSYTWYCIITWSLWSIVIFLILSLGENAYNIQNNSLYRFTLDLSNIAVFISWIPVHPVLWILALIRSVKRRRKKHTKFNCISILISIAFFVALHAAHTWLIGGI